MAHNIFAVPVFTLTFGILDWTKDEIQNIDIRTRKILTCTGNYHKNSNVDRLYTKREAGGRGLNSIFDVFVTRMISTAEHLKSTRDSNKYIELVIQHEKDRLMLVFYITLQFCIYVENPIDNTAQKISTKVKKCHQRKSQKTWINKNQHGFTITHQQQTCDYNEQLTHSWLKRPSMISHTEGFICAIQEQEIRTRSTYR